jgi:hypothetical protein
MEDAMETKNELGTNEAPSWLQEGRRWGYPDCCILFFNRVWAPLALATLGVQAKIIKGEPCSQDELALAHVYLEHQEHLDGTGYVPCPGCLAKKLGGAEYLPSLPSENPCACCHDEDDEDDEDDEEIEALLRDAEAGLIT